MWCFVGAKFGDSLQEIIVSIRQEFEERMPFLQPLRMENCETIKKNFNRNQEMLRVATVAMICSTIASL